MKVFIISGPSAAGKSVAAHELAKPGTKVIRAQTLQDQVLNPLYFNEGEPDLIIDETDRTSGPYVARALLDTKVRFRKVFVITQESQVAESMQSVLPGVSTFHLKLTAK